jgi:hypothetical protein
MKASIREFEPSDEEPVVGPSLRAWEPVFAVEEMLGPELFVWLRGDWRAGRAQEVRGVFADHAQWVWVAEAGGEPIGFVAATLARESGVGGDLHDRRRSGRQGQGVGTAPDRVATAWLRRSGW